MTVRNQKKAEIRTEKYSREQEIKNTKKMRDILEDLPGFCRQYFRGIEESTGARTRLAYAYDLRVFFEFIQRENPSLKNTSIRDFPISILERIGREDIEEYLDFLTYYEKDGQVFTNDARGKARKLSAVRSLFKYFYTSEILTKDVTALVPLPKLHEKPIVRLDSDEVAKMLMKADSGAELTRSQQRFHDKTRLRDMAILTLLLNTGIRVSEMVGIDLRDSRLGNAGLQELKKRERAGYEYETAEASFVVLMHKVMNLWPSYFTLEGFRVIIEKRGEGDRVVSEATVKLSVGGVSQLTAAEGDGPVNALDLALRKALERFYPALRDVSLIDFKVRILENLNGTAAQTRVRIQSHDSTSVWDTVGVSENIIEASWIALANSQEGTEP